MISIIVTSTWTLVSNISSFNFFSVRNNTQISLKRSERINFVPELPRGGLMPNIHFASANDNPKNQKFQDSR